MMVQVVPMHPRRSRFVRPVVILLLGGMFTASGLCADVTLSVAEIAAAVRPSLVTVTQVGREGPNGSGSGFVISGEGLIATNRHVIGQGQRLRVETSDGRKHDVTEIVASDAQMDLAILRVATKDLLPLNFADSDSAKQGEAIVAMGNPKGMSYSVVEGVISEPKREIEGRPMIQVAIPIEPGNSGGPLLDRQGRVLGVLTLKFALAENLGFAMPVNALKRLWEKPNPVPMQRWLTIGVLNPRLWTTLFGAQWSQRAGVVEVAQTGSGFGGRSLCLWNQPPAEERFEAAVSVKLDDEAGAAGLAFCADGGDRHYGFYPTGGKLRLTRFDGPSVFTWKILGDRESEAYLPGDWNQLRVRVEGRRIQCFVNEKEVFDMEDEGFRGGRVGLCKFRTTVAAFKRLQSGWDLAVKPVAPELQAQLGRELEDFLASPDSKEEALGRLAKEAELGRRLILERQRALERDAASLKQLAGELHRRAVREELSAELSKSEESVNLLRCALLLSKHDNPELDVGGYEREFNEMVQDLVGEAEIGQGTEAAVRRIRRYLFEENGFHGSRSDYASRSNSYLNEVLDDREGLPITLSVVFVELARRLGVREVAGIPLPGRFMVGYREAGAAQFSIIDAYDGGKELTLAEAVDLVSEDGRVSKKATQPATAREVVLRMIRNLLGPTLEARNASRESLPYLDLLLALDPEAASERLSRAMARERLGDREGARGDVGWLLGHLPEGVREDRREMLEQWLEKLSR